MHKRPIAIGFILVGSLIFQLSPALAQRDGLDSFQGELPGLLQESFMRRLDSRRDSLEVLRLVKPIVKNITESVVTVFLDGHPTSLATVVSADDLAVTEASELRSGEIKVRLPDHRLLAASVVATQKSEDLALLRFEAKKLTPVHLVRHQPPVGSFLVSAGVDGEVLGLGVTGAEVRTITENGILGVGYSEAASEGVKVTGVLPGSGAAVAGLEIGDDILSIDGTPIENGNVLKQVIGALYPGDFVAAEVRRGNKKRIVEIEIRDLSIAHETESDARVHGARSGRLAGFNGVLQHDTVLEPDQCGGPVLDLSGQVVGINIARAGRVCTYLYPTDKLEPVLKSMIQSSKLP